MKSFFFLFVLLFGCTVFAQQYIGGTQSPNFPDWTVYNAANSDLPSDEITDIVIGTNVLVGTYSGGFAVYNGIDWAVFDTVNSDLPGMRVICFANDGTGGTWIGTRGAGLVYWNGTSFTQYTMTNSLLPSTWVNALFVSSMGIVWVGTENGLVKIDGPQWTVYQPTNSGLPKPGVYSITEYSGAIWAGTWNGGIVKIEIDTITPIPHGSSQPNCLYNDGIGNLWVGTTNEGLVKYDGTEWTSYTYNNTGGAEINNVRAVKMDGNGVYWVGTDHSGLYKWDGVTWTRFTPDNSGLPSPEITTIAIDAGGNVWVGTRGLGIGVYDQPVGIDDLPAAPAGFSLDQNFPNPFNPATDIKFSIPNGAYVTLTVYDILGSEIATLVNEYKNAGVYEVQFDAAELPSGTYFYRLATGTYSETKKMMMVK